MQSNFSMHFTILQQFPAQELLAFHFLLSIKKTLKSSIIPMLIQNRNSQMWYYCIIQSGCAFWSDCISLQCEQIKQ